jgi:uncharacterized protein (TIGR00730 family)
LTPPRRAVCVYCGSNANVPPTYLELAAKVGSGIAARNWTLVWGGSQAAMMGVLAQSARHAGAPTIGVIPRALVDREFADTGADELHVVETMRERKAVMDGHADAFLALPGGLGTCEELFEVWTARALGMHSKPVVLLDPDGHWAGLLSWVRALRARGFASDAALDALTVTASVDAALDACGPVS